MVDSLRLNGQVNTVPQAGDVATPKNVAFRGTSNSLERTPQEDSFEKKGMSTGAKIGIGAAIALAVGVAADFAFAKGKHVKSLLGMADDAVHATEGKADDAVRAAEAKADDAVRAAEAKADDAVSQAGAKAEADVKPVLSSAEKMKAKLIKDGKMDFEVIVDGNKVAVKNGEIVECINPQGQKWVIDDKTNPEFVAKINKAIEEKMNSVIRVNTPYSQAELGEQLWSKKISDLSAEQQERLLNTLLPQENAVARNAIQKCMNAGEGHVHEYVQGLRNIETNLGAFIGKENVAGVFRSEAVMTKPIKDLKLGDVITNFEAKPELFKGYNKDSSLVTFLENVGNTEFKTLVGRNTEKSLMESTELLSYLIKHYNG